MHARKWLPMTLLALVSPFGQQAATQVPTKANTEQPARQIYELRTYVLNANGDHALIDNYLEMALIPALQRLGAGPVGVFTELPPARKPKTPRPPMMHVLITYPSLLTWYSQDRALDKDRAYQSAAESYLSAPKAKPAYARMKTRILKAFSGWPQIVVGDTSAQRIFEMRTYDSHSEQKHALKVEMFNRHEFKVFNNVGFKSVFYGQALAGENLPSLTYMLRYKDMAENKALWSKFRSDPGWLELKGKKRYRATVSGIESVLLKPTAYSQL